MVDWFKNNQSHSSIFQMSTLPHSQSSLETVKKHDELIQKVENIKKQNTLDVPADDNAIKRALRKLKEPITLFGEDARLRRERLKNIMLNLPENEISLLKEIPIESSKMEEEKIAKSEYFSTGSSQLTQIREFLTKYSIAKSANRIEDQKKLWKSTISVNFDENQNLKNKLDLIDKLTHFTNIASQIDGPRPVNHCLISEKNDFVLTGTWSGKIKSWNIPSCQLKNTYTHGTSLITGLAIPQNEKNFFFASGGADHMVKLWNEKECIGTLSGHTNRLGKINFHPSGRFLGSTSLDMTWILWDVEKKCEIYKQDGHSMGVYSIAFHPDGSLCCTGDLGGNSIVWDLRSGKRILPLTGHCKQILSIDFSPNGFEIASASDDKSVKIWDLRKRKCSYTIPAHSKFISTVKYEPVHGRFLITSSYDKTVKIWTSNEYKNVKTLIGHEDKVMSVDYSNGKFDLLNFRDDRDIGMG